MILHMRLGLHLLLLSLASCLTSAFINYPPNYVDKFLFGANNNNKFHIGAKTNEPTKHKPTELSNSVSDNNDLDTPAHGPVVNNENNLPRNVWKEKSGREIDFGFLLRELLQDDDESEEKHFHRFVKKKDPHFRVKWKKSKFLFAKEKMVKKYNQISKRQKLHPRTIVILPVIYGNGQVVPLEPLPTKFDHGNAAPDAGETDDRNKEVDVDERGDVLVSYPLLHTRARRAAKKTRSKSQRLGDQEKAERPQNMMMGGRAIEGGQKQSDDYDENGEPSPEDEDEEPDSSNPPTKKHKMPKNPDKHGKRAGKRKPSSHKPGSSYSGRKNNGSIANAKSEVGRAQATALSKTGDAKATAANGTSANALAMSSHDEGHASAAADTLGEDGAKASALSKGKGNALGTSVSRGEGNSAANAISVNGGKARADSDAFRGGNSTSNAVASGRGKATSNSRGRKGHSKSAAVAKGTGVAKSNSWAGAEDGTSDSMALSQGGDVVANSRTSGSGSSVSVGHTKGTGSALSNSVSRDGDTKADSVAVQGDSVANAMNGSGEFTLDEDDLALE